MWLQLWDSILLLYCQHLPTWHEKCRPFTHMLRQKCLGKIPFKANLKQPAIWFLYLPSLVTIYPSKTQMVFYLFQVAAFERQVLCHAPWSGGFGVVGAGRDARDMCKAEDVVRCGDWMWEFLPKEAVVEIEWQKQRASVYVTRRGPPAIYKVVRTPSNPMKSHGCKWV